MNLKELYQEIILEHGKNPRNLRKTENFNKDAKGHNPLCGDNVHVYLKLNGQKIVEDISFEGSGCAISMASASIWRSWRKKRMACLESRGDGSRNSWAGSSRTWETSSGSPTSSFVLHGILNWLWSLSI